MRCRSERVWASGRVSRETQCVGAERVHWGRGLAWFALLVLGVCGSAAVVTLPDLEPSPDPSARLMPRPRDTRGNRVEAVAFSADGRTLLSCGADGIMEFWPMEEVLRGRPAAPSTMLEDRPLLAAAYSRDGRHFAVAGVGSALIGRLDGGVCRDVLRLEGRTYRCLAISPEGTQLALGGDDGVVRVLNINTGHELLRLSSHMDSVRSLAFSPHGRRLISSGQDRRVILWDLESGRAIKNLTSPGASPVQFAAFSPDGRTVAIGDADENCSDVEIHDAQTGRVQARLSGHRAGIRALAFAPDGKTLATAGLDQKLIIWDLDAGSVRQCLDEHVGLVDSLAFSPDGSHLAFGGENQMLSIWELASTRLLSINCQTHARAERHLTHLSPLGKTVLPGA